MITFFNGWWLKQLSLAMVRPLCNPENYTSTIDIKTLWLGGYSFFPSHTFFSWNILQVSTCRFSYLQSLYNDENSVIYCFISSNWNRKYFSFWKKKNNTASWYMKIHELKRMNDVQKILLFFFRSFIKKLQRL